MRNATIRKKLLKEQDMIRRFMRYPQRVIVPYDIPQWNNNPSYQWVEPNPVRNRLGTWPALDKH